MRPCTRGTPLWRWDLHGVPFPLTSRGSAIPSQASKQEAVCSSAHWDQGSRPSCPRSPPHSCPLRRPVASPLIISVTVPGALSGFIRRAASSRWCRSHAQKPSMTHRGPQLHRVQTHEGLPGSSFRLLCQPVHHGQLLSYIALPATEHSPPLMFTLFLYLFMCP